MTDSEKLLYSESRQPRKLRRRIILLVSLPLIWIIGVWLFAANLQNIKDQITAWQNPLSPEIAAIAEESGLSSRGKFLLQISRTELNDRDDFNRNCPIKEDQAFLLGCYVFDSKRIFIFNVTDERIAGIKTVTTAHEMLHAAYDRLSDSERTRVNELLNQERASIDNPEILDLMELYEETEPGQEFNELHSLLATEEKTLTAELEKYYEKYFTDRSRVIAIYEKYQSVFDELNARITELQDKMTTEEESINAAIANYENNLAAYNRDVDFFNACADRTGCFTSLAIFNAQRNQLLARADNLTAAEKAINAAIDQYNADVEELNALGVEAEKLNQSLDSRAEQIE